jgi:hypothetical protein
MHQTMEDKWKQSRIMYWAFKIVNETCGTGIFIEFGATARQVDYSDVFTESYNLCGGVNLHLCETAVSNGPIYISRITNIYGKSVSF